MLPGGDAGAVVNQAILTKDNPQGDVLFGVDNTFLSRALDEDLFVAYESPALDGVDPSAACSTTEHRVTPIDTGDVCLNYDKAGLADAGLDPPDLARRPHRPGVRRHARGREPGNVVAGPGVPARHRRRVRRGRLAGLLEGPARPTTSRSPTAGRTPTTAGSPAAPAAAATGPSSSATPPARRPRSSTPSSRSTRRPPAWSSTAATARSSSPGSCSGTEHEAEAQQLIDFMLSPTFQSDIPLNMFVYPVTDVDLPEEFVKYGAEPRGPVPARRRPGRRAP